VPHASDSRFLVLHALRLKGFADVDAIVDQTGLYPSEVHGFLDHLKVAELVLHRTGRMSGWALTPAGRARHAELIGAELEATGRREDVDRAYRLFLPVNRVFLGVCTDWQMREVDGQQVLNDHSDPAYDKAVVGRLQQVDDEAQSVCAVLSTVLGRFTRYGRRLAIARERVEGGDTDWFTKPLIDSYHTVWFELHEDLLATLGIERSKEEPA
jgi:hypothetical protein